MNERTEERANERTNETVINQSMNQSMNLFTKVVNLAMDTTGKASLSKHFLDFRIP